MSAVRRSPVLLLVCLVGIGLLAGCQGNEASSDKIQWTPMFGDLTNDITEVIAQVGDIAITQRMLDLYIDELPPRLKNGYQGDDGERLALKAMVDQALMVQGAMAVKIYNDQDVARQLISDRRNTLDYAMRNYGLLRANKPGEDDLREFFEKNKANYRHQGLAMARHVECLTKADADLAYRRLKKGDVRDTFAHVAVDISVNEDTRKAAGITGWFSRGGFIPFMRSAKEFSTVVYDLDIGLYAPILIGDRWHVVEVTEREYERPQTFSEAKEKVVLDMLPGWQNGLIKDYLLEARITYKVAMLGKYAPGQGATVDELFKRAMAAVEPERKLSLLSMIHTDYPTSDRADDALFMSANVALETWSDRRIAERYLLMLLKEYPESELIEDAKFLNKNLHNPKKLNPQSIEDLRNN